MTDLIITIGHSNSPVRLLAAMRIDVEPEYLPHLDEFPLPADQPR